MIRRLRELMNGFITQNQILLLILRSRQALILLLRLPLRFILLLKHLLVLRRRGPLFIFLA